MKGTNMNVLDLPISNIFQEPLTYDWAHKFQPFGRLKNGPSESHMYGTTQTLIMRLRTNTNIVSWFTFLVCSFQRDEKFFVMHIKQSASTLQVWRGMMKRCSVSYPSFPASQFVWLELWTNDVFSAACPKDV